MKIDKRVNTRMISIARKIAITADTDCLGYETFTFNGEKLYHVGCHQLVTAGELREMLYDTTLKDIRKGFQDRNAGYYDKWYRYNRKDDGRAYDAGTRLALQEGCTEDCTIIECVGGVQ